MGYQRTVIYSCCSESACHVFLSFNNLFPLSLSVLLINHLDDFRLITIRQKVMRWVDVLQAFLIVLSPLIINEFIFVFDLDRENRHSIDKFLGIGSIIFWEIHINKASKRMTISSHSYDSIFVSMSINHLLMKSSFIISWANILTILRIDGIAIQNSISFIGIEFSNCVLFFLLYSLFILCLKFSYLSIMFFFERKVLFHYTIHISIIYINYYNLFSFFKGLVFILQSKFFCKLFFESAPFVLIIQFSSLSIVYCCIMSLIMLWLISSNMWVHVESFEMISINNTSNGIFNIGSSI